MFKKQNKDTSNFETFNESFDFSNGEHLSIVSLLVLN